MTQTDMFTYEDVKEEMTRRKNRRSDMLRAFQQQGELTTKDMLQFGSGFSSRLKELRRAGHRIVRRYDGPGKNSYVYLGKFEEDESL